MDHLLSVQMEKDHKKIDILFKKFSDMLDEKNVHYKKAFSKFKWALKKHFLIEEKVIFAISMEESNIQNINQLVSEHKLMDEVLNEIEDEIPDGDFDLGSFKEKLDSHAEFEDEVFYPELDEILDEKQREEINEKIKEIYSE